MGNTIDASLLNDDAMAEQMGGHATATSSRTSSPTNRRSARTNTTDLGGKGGINNTNGHSPSPQRARRTSLSNSGPTSPARVAPCTKSEAWKAEATHARTAADDSIVEATYSEGSKDSHSSGGSGLPTAATSDGGEQKTKQRKKSQVGLAASHTVPSALPPPLPSRVVPSAHL
jgi:hypothetical protein